MTAPTLNTLAILVLISSSSLAQLQLSFDDADVLDRVWTLQTGDYNAARVSHNSEGLFALLIEERRGPFPAQLSLNQYIALPTLPDGNTGYIGFVPPVELTGFQFYVQGIAWDYALLQLVRSPVAAIQFRGRLIGPVIGGPVGPTDPLD